MKFLLSKNDSSAIFRSGKCIGFAEILPVSSSYEIPIEIQSQLDSLHFRLSKTERRNIHIESQEPFPHNNDIPLTWNNLNCQTNEERKGNIVRTYSNPKSYPLKCYFCSNKEQYKTKKH